jgi:hypothetical protein
VGIASSQPSSSATACWVVFLNVLLAEAGLPLPAIPILVTLGALAAGGGSRIQAIIIAGIAGALIADLSWYCAGRCYGRRVPGLLCNKQHALLGTLIHFREFKERRYAISSPSISTSLWGGCGCFGLTPGGVHARFTLQGGRIELLSNRCSAG